MFIEEDDYLEKDKRAAKCRHNNVRKALRKQSISRHNYGIDWYDNLHQYSKNKIHCSCGICRFRSVYDPDNKTMSDMRKIISCDEQYDEYLRTG